VLDAESLRKQVTVPEEDLKKYYTENIARFSTPEERRARHILVKAEKNAPADVRAKAKAKAEEILAEVKKNPAAFPELAKKYSEDPGSAERGGDLDFFGRGAMTGPFDEAVFALKPGQLSGVVETDFGYHIIEVTAVRGGEKKSYEQVRAQIEDEVRRQLAQKRFSEVAVDFTNMVYEQSDSLKPAADKFKLEIKRAQEVRHAPGTGASGPLASAKFLDALFSPETLHNKRNTDAVETAPSQLVSGRVVRYTPAHTLPLAEVKDKVREKVAAQMASALAHKDGEARLADLKKDSNAALTGPAVVVSRATAKDLPRPVIDAVLRADPSKLPQPVGVDLGEAGYAVARITKVLGRDPIAAETGRAQAQYAQAWGDAEAQAYYAALKSRLKVDINPSSVTAAAEGASGASK
jgi:peptidyl-prolyl cis-trans isomerase D